VCVWQVRIDETNTNYRATALGVVTSSPYIITLPQHFRRPLPHVLWVTPSARYVFGQKVRAWCLLNWLLAWLVLGWVCGWWVGGWDVRTAVVGWWVAFFLFSFYYYSFIHFNKHTTTTEHSSVHLSLAMYNGHNYTTDIYYLCTHNNYTKRYTDSHADTGTYRQAIGQAHCKQSHTDICLERFTVLTDWLHATCVDYSNSK